MGRIRAMFQLGDSSRPAFSRAFLFVGHGGTTHIREVEERIHSFVLFMGTIPTSPVNPERMPSADADRQDHHANQEVPLLLFSGPAV